jgi:hypothetical protein
MSAGNRQTLPSGAVRLTGELTRSGVFEYVRPNGQAVREYRPADEVAKADSLASIEDLPVTVGHPRSGVSGATLDAVSAGHVRSPVASDEAGATLVRGTITVAKSDARAGVQSGKLTETSMGYDCRLDETPGVTPAGQRYDAVQRDLVYNHVALLPPGGARLGTRLDGAENDRVLRLDAAGNQTTDTERTIMKIRVKKADGKEVEFEQHSPEHFSHVEAERDAACARADALEAEVKTHREDAAKAARAELETVAVGVLGKEFKADGKSDRDVKAAVIGARFPSVKLDGKDEAYVSAMFDAALAASPAPAKRKDGSQVKLARELGRADALPPFLKKKGEKDEDEEEDETDKKAKEAAKKADSAWERS